MDTLQFRRHRAKPYVVATPILPVLAAIILFVGSAETSALAVATYPGDPSFGLVPSASVTTAQGESFGGEKKLTGSVTADVPLGLSEDRRVIAAAAADSLLRAEESENRVRGETYAALLTLYREAWLAQEELRVLEAEDELIDAEVAFREGTLARRITWLRLVYAAGLGAHRVGPRERPLDSRGTGPKGGLRPGARCPAGSRSSPYDPNRVFRLESKWLGFL